jgi:hypothetical protein
LTFLEDLGEARNDISKLLRLREMANMTSSSQMTTGITYGDAITLTMGWIKITYNVESKETEQQIIWLTASMTKLPPL